MLAFSLLGLSRLFLPLPFVIEVVIFSIYTMGCNFLLGRVGFISFGQPAYLAAGAYGTAFYLFYFGANPYVGLLVGILSALAVSVIVGPLFVRLRSDYFALVNLALAVIVYYLMQKVLADITKGDNGLWFLTNISSTPILDLGKPNEFFAFTLIVAIAVWAFYKYLDDSIFGACCLATKVNEDKVQFLGYSNFRIRLLAFVIANTTTAPRGRDVCGLSGVSQPGDYEPRTCRRSGGGHDPRRHGNALRTDRRRLRVHRPQGRDQQTHRKLGAFHRIHARVHHARGRERHLGLVAAGAREALQAPESGRHPARDRTGPQLMDASAAPVGRDLWAQHR